MVYLLNRSKKGISLGGWSLLNRSDEARVISDDIWLAPGDVRSVTMGSIPLSNKGVLITLLDDNGVKIDGVSYTKEQAGVEGEIVVFQVILRLLTGRAGVCHPPMTDHASGCDKRESGIDSLQGKIMPLSEVPG